MKINNQNFITGPLIIDIDGFDLTEEDRSLIENRLVGGVILFSRNYENKTQLIKLCKAIKVINPNCLVAVDQEGGRVQRFRHEFTRLPPMQKLGDLYSRDPSLAIKTSENMGWLMAVELVLCGVDISFAPVLDVDDSFSDVIGDRAFANHPEVISKLAEAFIMGMNSAGMKATGKHFPGHGSVKQDSHLELPVDLRDLDEITGWDLIPFQRLIGQLDGIMPAHIVFPAVDEDPVGFSSFWLKDSLRKRLGFEGVIFSDDLTMEGAAKVGGYSLRAEKAIEAGCDALLVCNNRPGVLEILKFLESRSDLQINSRLATMRATAMSYESDIMRHPRWAEAQSQLDSL